MTVTMAPGASSDCTKAYPIASDAPTTSPSHGYTSSVHGESPRVILEKRYVLVHPRVHEAKRDPARFCRANSRRSSWLDGSAQLEPVELARPRRVSAGTSRGTSSSARGHMNYD